MIRSMAGVVVGFAVYLGAVGQSLSQQSVPGPVQSNLSKDLSNIQEMIQQYNSRETIPAKNITDLRDWNPMKVDPNNVSESLVPKSSDYAIVFEQLASVKQSADLKSDTIAMLPKGAFLRKFGENQGFYKVEVAGKEGWLQKSSTISPQFLNYNEIFDPKYGNSFTWRATAGGSNQGDMFDKIISGLVDLRDKWKNNDYIQAEGFEISLGMPLSVNFAFKFK